MASAFQTALLLTVALAASTVGMVSCQQISAMAEHSFVVVQGGEAVAWGADNWGEVSGTPPGKT